MKSSIIAKLEAMQKRYKEIEAHLIDIKVIANQQYFRELSKEYAQLTDIIQCFQSLNTVQKNMEIAETLICDPEMREIAQEELKEMKKRHKEFEKQLQILLLTSDSNDEKNCFLEIRAGTGGGEAAIFAGDLFRMYSRYAESCHWRMEVIHASEGERGGYKEIITKISGNSVYGRLKFESGGHRVQRVPETESQGRIHTSTCTVAVLAEISAEELTDINHSDLRIDTFRSSGAGGQHVNTTDSAIRITHIPTGLVVECQDERSQHKNKAKALSVLAARIRAKEMQKRSEAKASERRNLLGSGDRSDRIRTYNFPQSRITDHRINLTLHCLDAVITGKLDILIQPIINEHKADQLSALSEKY
ncbi:MAG: peptide chain release factor 1 [Candidatus Arsenophonus melophagi]|nr:peptide chain release factor 1 [Candidatus Arsenophonus melophagi]